MTRMDTALAAGKRWRRPSSKSHRFGDLRLLAEPEGAGLLGDKELCFRYQRVK